MGRLMEGKSAIDENMEPKIKQLRPWHKSMARALVCGAKRPKDLATIFGMSPGQISVIMGTPLFEAEVQRLQSLIEYEAVDMATEIQMRQPLALEAIDRGLLQGDADKAAKVGFEILDRTGFPKGAPVQQHLHLHAHKEVHEMPTEDLLESAMELISGCDS